MPWQQYVADVAGEVDEDGNLRYPLVVITVPRQSGKTTMMLATLIARALRSNRAKVWHTAQTGAEAANKFLELAGIMETSPLGPYVKIRRAQGSWGATFSNGSTLKPHPPTEASLHGEQSDLNLIDEAWSFDQVKGMAIIQAITPTQATRPGAQTVITSTAGTADSIWFRSYVERGRAGSEGIAYFEWSIPDDVDPTDLEAVAAHHPAVGHTINMKALEAAAAQMTPGEFARAYGNRWSESKELVFPADAWLRARTEIAIPDDARVAFGAAVSVDRKSAAICAAAIVGGIPVVELIEFRPGTEWVGPRLKELNAKHRSDVCVDRYGPSGTVADFLDLNKVKVLPLASRDLTAACGEVHDRVMQGRILFRPHQSMDDAVKHATKRPVGDAWAWARRGTEVSIAPLEAATLALRAITHVKPAPQKPSVHFAQE